MNKIISISLNNRSYKLEETGYEMLQRYLAQAATKLATNPDKDEIMKDFEQAIAEKCDQYLVGKKDVITMGEVEAVVKAMGPVDEGETHEAKDEPQEDAPKKLYRIKDRFAVTGVLAGIASYINLDPALVRFMFIILVLLSQGWIIIPYIAFGFFVPLATTEEEKASARGERRDAQTLIEKAKARYAEYTSANKEEKKKMRGDVEEVVNNNIHRVVGPIEQGLKKTGSFFVALCIIVLTIFFVFIVAGLLAANPNIHLPFARGQAAWLIVTFFASCYWIVLTPFYAALRNIRYAQRPPKFGDIFQDVWFVALFIAAIVLLVYTSIRIFPPVHRAFDISMHYLQSNILPE